MTYAETARGWLAAGFGPLPLPAGQKHSPPTGWTGKDAPMPSAADVAAWSEDHAGGNVALRLPSHVVALDVDAYDGRLGWPTLLSTVGRRGALPPTHRISPRDDGQSGHYLYRLPAGTTDEGFVAELAGGGVDVLRHGHRYSIAPGSVHPSGAVYRLYGPDGTEVAGVVRVDDLPELLAPWVEELQRPALAVAPAVHADEVPDRSALSVAECRRLDAYTRKVVEREVDRLNACTAAATSDGRDYRGPAWNATTFEVSCTLLELANSPWSQLTEQCACELVREHAPRDRDFTDAVVDKAFGSARHRVGSKARPLPVDRTPPATGGPVDPFEDPTGGTWAAGRPSASPGIQTPDGPGPAAPDATGEEDGRRGPSIATQLVRLGLARYSFARSTEGDPFALPKDGPPIVRTLRGGSDSLRAELAHRHYASTGKAAPQGALTDAITTLTGAAEQAAPVPLALRVAEADGALWLDLGDATGRAVRLDRAGWSVVDVAPVLFRRTELTGPLPVPERGGTLAGLFELVNVSPADQPVVAAVLLAGLLPDIPHPVTFLTGEQGVGKSSAQRILTSVIDASPVPLRKPPTDVESWTVAAAGSWVVGVDNVSHIPPWFSDSLCRAATGDGDVRRRYYTNGELHVFAFRRCVWLNGIDLTGIRDDLADRAVTVRLESLAGRRREDAALARQWAAAHPRVLGALLDLAVRVLGALPTVQLDDPPRMIDFARVLAAVDSILGTDGLGRYRHLADDLAADAVSGDPVLAAIAATILQPWEGTAAQLLTLLDTGRWTFEARPRDWPRDARAMGSVLRRRGPSLRQLGWTVDDLGRGGKAKAVRFRLLPPAGEAAA